MDGAGVAAGALGAWWESVRGFFTPATLFLVVNLVIGTIALTSRSHQRRRRGGHGINHDDDAHGNHHQEPLHQENQYYQQQQQHEQQHVPPPAPLARTSSVLDRIRSIGLYRFRSGDFPPEYAAPTPDSHDAVAGPGSEDTHYARSRSKPAPVREKKRATPSRIKKSSSEVRKSEVAPAPARAVQAAALVEEEEDVVDARADEFTDNLAQSPPQQEEVYHQDEYQYVPPLRPAPLPRTSSVLDRLRSFSLYRFRSGDLAPEQDAAEDDDDDADTPAAGDNKQAAHYARSRSEPGREQSKKDKQQQQQQQQQGGESRMTKSSSAAPRKPAQEEVEPDSVDARADNFINSFRQQLQLQRLNSLLNYKEMLNRGAK